MSELSENFNLKEYMEKIVTDKLERFKLFTEWSDETKKEFKELLSKLKEPFDKENETTKSKGDRLEKVVEFIINKTYFFEIYKNVRTKTNEIDEVIVLSDRGKQALETFGISKELLQIDEEVFLGECKNYASSLNVTYVGKFYSLLIATNVSFGIIFTQNGLTGDTDGYKDAYGLTKVLRIIEKYANNKEFYILTFTLEDYEKLLEGVSFFDLVKAKKLELKLATDYHNFIKEKEHENREKLENIINEIRR